MSTSISMRRVMLLTLLALALPTAALADTFFNTGAFASGLVSPNVNTLGGLSATSSMNLNVVGLSQRFRILGLSLTTGCQLAGPGLCTVSGNAGSTLEVFSPATSGTVVFSTSLAGLSADVTKGTGTAAFTMSLGNIPALFCVRCELSVGFTWTLSPSPSGTLVAGNARITGVNVIPEPGTLALFGTGLMSLAGLARRKLKLPI